LKHQTICLVSFGFLLGLGAVGCKEHNPAFHKPADGSASPSPDLAADTPVGTDRPADAPGVPKDAEVRGDTPAGPRDGGVDGPRLADSAGETGSEPTDAPVFDGRADARADSTPARDAVFDASIPDGAVGPSHDAPPVSLDAEQTDVPTQVTDAAADSAVDGIEGDAFDDVLPDAEGPSTWSDADVSQPDSN